MCVSAFHTQGHECVMFRLTELLHPNLSFIWGQNLPESAPWWTSALRTAEFNKLPVPAPVEYLSHEFPLPVHAEVAPALCASDPDAAAEAVRLHKKTSCKKKRKLKRAAAAAIIFKKNFIKSL